MIFFFPGFVVGFGGFGGDGRAVPLVLLFVGFFVVEFLSFYRGRERRRLNDDRPRDRRVKTEP